MEQMLLTNDQIILTDEQTVAKNSGFDKCSNEMYVKIQNPTKCSSIYQHKM